MINFKEYYDIVNSSDGISDKEKSTLIKLVKPCFDFSEYMIDRTGKSAEDIQNEIELMLLEKREEINRDSEDLLKLTLRDYTQISTSRIVKLIIEYAKDQGYQNRDLLKSSLNQLVGMSIKNELYDKHGLI